MAIGPAVCRRDGQRAFFLAVSDTKYTMSKCLHRMHREVITMATLKVRNLTEKMLRALRVCAAQHSQSMEAEVREILEAAISPRERVNLGSMLAEMGSQARLSNKKFAMFEQVRDKAPFRPVSFE